MCPADVEAILTQYAQGPTQLEAALAGLACSDLNPAATSDTWTIRQLVRLITALAGERTL